MILHLSFTLATTTNNSLPHYPLPTSTTPHHPLLHLIALYSRPHYTTPPICSLAPSFLPRVNQPMISTIAPFVRLDPVHCPLSTCHLPLPTAVFHFHLCLVNDIIPLSFYPRRWRCGTVVIWKGRPKLFF